MPPISFGAREQVPASVYIAVNRLRT